jgi:hypothetical protein
MHLLCSDWFITCVGQKMEGNCDPKTTTHSLDGVKKSAVVLSNLGDWSLRISTMYRNSPKQNSEGFLVKIIILGNVVVR